jgi:hypothetical protein
LSYDFGINSGLGTGHDNHYICSDQEWIINLGGSYAKELRNLLTLRGYSKEKPCVN